LILYVEEENHGRNAELITKHFIAEGVVCDHSILIVDVERKPEAIVIYFYFFYIMSKLMLIYFRITNSNYIIQLCILFHERTGPSFDQNRSQTAHPPPTIRCKRNYVALDVPIESFYMRETVPFSHEKNPTYLIKFFDK